MRLLPIAPSVVDDSHVSNTERIVEGSRIVANELAEDFGFSHAGMRS